MAMGLTEKQTALLGIIKQHIEKTGLAPTFDEMVAATGIKSKSVIHRHLSALEARGAIRRKHASSRAIEVLGAAITAKDAVKALNEAAYLAAKLARKEAHPAADALRRVALDTDRIVDGGAT